MTEFTREQVAEHSTEKSFWIIIDGVVYDITKFVAMHPGGEGVLKPFAGKDATTEFYALHRADILEKYGPKYRIGTVSGETQKIAQSTELSTVPYAESSAFLNFHSPYYTESHRRFKKAIRSLLSKESGVWEEAKLNDALGKPPSKETFQKLGQAGFLASRIGPGPHMKRLFKELPGGVKPEEFDYFHELIAHEEMAAMGYPGYADGLACGMVIGLPPVLVFGKPDLQNKVIPEVLLGQKQICLAITEPTVGSDVANISTTAVKSSCGKFYIVNGVKKWITNGTFSDYFTTAVRTGGKGITGISVLLIPRTEGVETKVIKTSYSSAAGTAYVIFENVKVPVENLLGKENEGFKAIMYNFNHERWLICAQSVRASRLVVEECFKWANQRKVFGKPLLAQPVIRFKLAAMVAQVEAIQNWLENITFQMTKMPYKEQSVRLAGPIALLKYQCTRVGSFVADESCQIFGGRAITQTGMGQIIERYHRACKFAAILGGSEEIMADLGIKQAMKEFPKNARL